MSDERHGLPSSSLVPTLSLCPGALRMCNSVAKLSTAEAAAWAASGDRVHLYCEAPNLIDLSAWPEELDVAQRCLVERDKLLTEVFPTGHSFREFKEERLWLYCDTEKKIKRFSGRLDYGAFSATKKAPGIGLVVDYKSLYGDHEESSSNLQLRSQCILLWLNAPVAIEAMYAKIIQPLRGTSLKKPVLYTEKDLNESRKELNWILKRAEDPKAPLVPGIPQCKFCPARLKCPAAREVLEEVASASSVGTMTPTELSSFLDKCKTAAAIIELAESQAKALLRQSPDNVPGWWLKPNSPIRQVTDPQGLFGELVEAGLIDLPDFLKCTSVTIGHLEKRVFDRLKGDQGKKITVKEAKELVAKYLEEFVAYKDKEPTLSRKKDED